MIEQTPDFDGTSRSRMRMPQRAVPPSRGGAWFAVGAELLLKKLLLKRPLLQQRPHPGRQFGAVQGDEPMLLLLLQRLQPRKLPPQRLL